jgi:hypothetical protein
LERIQKIQRENEEFAQKSELELQKSFIRNSPEKKKDLLKLRSTSLDFRKVYFLNNFRMNKFIKIVCLSSSKNSINLFKNMLKMKHLP